MQIRRATAGDARAIAVVHVAASQAAYRGLIPDDVLASFTIERREASWRDILTTGDEAVWVAETDGRVLGWVCVGRSRDADADPGTAELQTMYVDPTCWRQGIGRALWAEAEPHLKAQAFAAVTLWVLQLNERAIGFYRDRGFREEPGQAVTRERGGRPLVQIRMRRELS